MTNKELYELNANNIYFMRKQAEKYAELANGATTIEEKARWAKRMMGCLNHAEMWEAENKILATLEASAMAAITAA